MCVVGEKKKERQWVHGWWEIKRKKELESGIYVYDGKMGSGKGKKKN